MGETRSRNIQDIDANPLQVPSCVTYILSKGTQFATKYFSYFFRSFLFKSPRRINELRRRSFVKCRD